MEDEIQEISEVHQEQENTVKLNEGGENNVSENVNEVETTPEKTEGEENKPKEEETNEREDDEPSDKDIDKEETDEVNLADIKEAEKAKEVLETKGFDYAQLQEEYNMSGEISRETRVKLTEVGITDEILDNYIEGQKAKVEKELDSISECIGGREQFNNVIKWAGENLEQAEIESINAVRDVNVMKIILKDLKERMEDKEGITPEYTKGEGGKPKADIFESQAQMMEAIRDKKYQKDTAYRQKIMTKIQASREAGIDLGI